MTERSGAAAARSHCGPAWLLACAILVAAVRLGLFVRRYAVNVLFWDQWDFLEPLFRGEGLWTLFTWQQGPERQGAGELLLGLVAWASHWDTRADGFVAVVLMAASAALALGLVRLAIGRWSVADMVIPVVFLSTKAYEVFVGTPNPAHGPLPLLFVLAFAATLFLRSPWLRIAAAVTASFFAIFTGFGIFLGPIALAVFAVDLYRRRGESLPSLVGIASVLVSLALYAVDFRFQPAVECFRFPDPHPLRYLGFLGAFAIRPFSWFRSSPAGGAGIALGSIALLGAAGVSAFLHLRGDHPVWRTAFVLSSFSLLFGANAAVGRACLGPTAAESSRYVPYALPAMLAAHLLLRAASSRSRPARLVLASFVLACSAGALKRERGMQAHLERVREGKAAWAKCYLAMADVEACDRATGFSIYPFPDATRLSQKLAWLRERRLGFFRDASTIR